MGGRDKSCRDGGKNKTKINTPGFMKCSLTQALAAVLVVVR